MRSSLRSAFFSDGGRPAVVGPVGGWSYRDLEAASDALRRELVKRGVGPGSVGSVLLPPSRSAVMTVHAIPRAGAVLAPADPKWSESEMIRFLEALRPRVLVHDPERPLPGESGYRLEGSFGAGGARPIALSVPSEPAAGPPRREMEGIHSVVWTSGTTGARRGVKLAWESHLANACGAIKRLGLGPNDRWAATLSLAHIGGLALVLRSAVAGSCLVTTGHGFEASALASLIDAGRVTHASLVPTMLRRLLDRSGSGAPPTSLRCLLVGGDATPSPILVAALSAGLPVALTYGLTETASQVATAPPDLVRRKPGTVGPALPGTEVKIGPRDEILVRGDTLMRGLLGQPEGRVPVPEGWLRTGDIGRLDDEGHLWLRGRMTDRIVTGGVNVDPREVEAVLAAHPDVREAAVVGVPDPMWGERVAALVCPERRRPFDPDELDRYARGELSSAGRPRLWLAASGLPRTATGKVDREAVRRCFRKEPGSSVPESGP